MNNSHIHIWCFDRVITKLNYSYPTKLPEYLGDREEVIYTLRSYMTYLMGNYRSDGWTEAARQLEIDLFKFNQDHQYFQQKMEVKGLVAA